MLFNTYVLPSGYLNETSLNSKTNESSLDISNDLVLGIIESSLDKSMKSKNGFSNELSLNSKLVCTCILFNEKLRVLIAPNSLLEAKETGDLKIVLSKLEKLDLLICDEWGYIPFEKEGSQLLFQVILECYERKSLIITTNLEFSKWNGIFYDQK